MKNKIIILIIIIGTLFITSCGKKQENLKEEIKSEVPIKITTIKGPPSMGFVKLFLDSEEEKTVNKYSKKIVSTPDELVAEVIKGEVDIASIPSNLASVIYNKTGGKIQVASIIALGNLYVVENGNNNIKTIKDLKGKTIYINGKGATPEIVLNYILKGNDLDPNKDVKIEFKSEASEVVSALVSNKNGVALLNQPFATVAQVKNPNIKISFALSDEWDKLPNIKKGSQVSGVVVFNKEFVEKNPKKVEQFLIEYNKSVEFLNNNIPESAKLMEKYDILPEKIALKAIPSTKITNITGIEMKEKISEYLKILYLAEPKVIGGSLPKEDFYYIK